MSAQVPIGPNLSEAERLNNDATGYRISHLKRLRNSKKTERFNELIFLHSPVGILNELFPFVQGKGQLNPTRYFRMSATRMNEWRQLGQAEQQAMIELAGAEAPLTACVEEASAIPAPAAVDPPAAKKAKKDIPAPAVVPKKASPKKESPPRSKTPSVTSTSPGNNTRSRRPVTCRGVNMEALLETVRTDVEKTVVGFRVLVGEAMHYKASRYGDNLSWPFAHDPEIVGAIPARGRKAENNTTMNLKWLCYQSPAPPPALNNHSKTDEQKLDFVTFKHTTCTGSLLMPGRHCCESCLKEASQLFRQCRVAADEKGTSEQSAEAMVRRLDDLQNEIRKNQQKRYELRKRGADVVISK